jgi:hypothetical protein
MRSKFLGFALVVLVAGAAYAQDWGQWGFDKAHASAVPYVGQALNQNLVNIVYDPLVPQEMAANGGDLLAHYQAPLVDGNDVYMMFKDGQYTTNNYASQKWGERKFSWSGGTLVTQWSFNSDWDAPGSALDFWEPVFHPALANGSLYVPGAGGSVFKVNKSNGVAVTRINPFPTDDGGTKGTVFVVSPITVSGTDLLYNVIQFTNVVNVYQNDIVDSWLVRIHSNDTFEKVSYSTLTTGAPAATASCLNAFSESQLPWPPSTTAVPPSVTCGTQRPGINASPAVGPDGTIYVITRAHFISRWGNLIAIRGNNLTQKWIASLRERFHDGCGVPISLGGTLPPNGALGGCRTGANYGVDPATNGPGGGRVLDDSSATPLVAADGSIYYGSYTRYNYAQGHLMRFSSTGQFLGTYNFGWDVTPGVVGSTNVAIKDNHYGGLGSYCNTESVCPSDESGRAYPEAYFITQLSPTIRSDAFSDRGDLLMTPVWSFQNTNTLSCTRQPDGSVTCVSDHPNGFEWCVNAFVVDANQTLYANSEDGNLFKIPQFGVGVTRIFQQLALGAAYTPTSMGADGKIYSQNAGHLFVAGN